jgi:GNAT superfamily N-acetyltransferase
MATALNQSDSRPQTPEPSPRVIHVGHTVLAAAELTALRCFVIQPEAPWFSEPEQIYLSRSLAGEFAATSDDYSFVIMIDGRPAAHAWYQASRRHPQVAVLGYVFTDPTWRGRGLSGRICSLIGEHFAARGGKCMYLGTANPAARRLYEKHGFIAYHGHAMRRLGPPMEERKFDEAYFQSGPKLSTRPAEWGDLAGLVVLYTGKFPWIVRDFTEDLILPPGVELKRCVSIGMALLLRGEAPGNSLHVLETQTGRIVGCAAVVAGPSAKGLAFEFIVHPNFSRSATACLRDFLPPATPLLSYASSTDTTKLGILQDLGFAVTREDAVIILRRS